MHEKITYNCTQNIFFKLFKIQITISVRIQMGASYIHTHTLGLLVALGVF